VTSGAPRAAGPSAATPESYFWPLVCLAAVILPQVLVPSRLRLGPPSAVPIIEGTVLLVLLALAARRGPVPRGARPLVLSLFGLLILANTAEAARLVVVVLRGHPEGGSAPTVTQLLVAATILLSTNVVTFGLMYWQLDGGGPAGRLARPEPYPDFQFPQTGSEGLSPPGWQPVFADHLYVSYTNLVAFSPADAQPLTVRAKGLMTVQSLISVGVLVVVLARVINVLPS